MRNVHGRRPLDPIKLSSGPRPAGKPRLSLGRLTRLVALPRTFGMDILLAMKHEACAYR